MAAALLLAVTAGCARVPMSGPVREAGPVPAAAGPLVAPDVGDVAPEPIPGDSTAVLLDKFLQACAVQTDGRAAARRFLTPRASAGWHPQTAGVAVYDTGSATVSALSGDDTRYDVQIGQIGVIGPDGAYAYQPGTPTFRYAFARVGGQWRLDSLPSALVLSASQVQRGFKPVQLFFPAREEATQLVPDLVYLPVLRSELPREIVSRLLSGPTGWLSPAVRTVLPSATRLLSVSLDAGVATVELSAEARTAAAAPDLAAQLAWTLTWPDNGAGVTAVQLVVAGSRVGGPVDATTFGAYDPSGPVPATAYVVQGQVLHPVSGTAGGAGGPSAPSPPANPLEPGVDLGPAVDSASVDSAREPWVAVLHGDGLRLSVGQLSAPPAQASTATLAAPGTSPTWGPGTSGAWTVVSDANGPRAVLVNRTGQQAGATLVPPAGGLGTVRAMRIARDGARVAVVSGSGQLYVGVVHRVAGQWVVDGLMPQAPDLSGVADVAWQDFGTLVALSHPNQAPGPSLVRVSVGSTLPPAALPLSGVTGTVTAVAAAPVPSILVTTTTQTATALWQPAAPPAASVPLAQAPVAQPPLRDPSYPR